jgi:hypothetical protein
MSSAAADLPSMPAAGREPGLDIGRGALLVAMLAVHVVSAHGGTGHVRVLHEQLGVFLISAGFVGLSGFVIGLHSRGSPGSQLAHGLDRALHLVLVMLAYGILLSLARHGLALAAGGPAGCTAERGWVPPVRFDDLGILLPIALVQALAPLARAGRLTPPTLAVAAAAIMCLPVLLRGVAHPVVGVLTQRTVTPFYTVTTFVAVGLAGVALARGRWAILAPRTISPAGGLAGIAIAVVAALPSVSRAVLDPVHLAAGELTGSVATLAYWTAALGLLVRGFLGLRATGPLQRGFAVLGRHSLLVFVAHDFLLALDVHARDRLGIDKGGVVVVALFAINLLVLLGLAALVDRRAGVRAAADRLLLGRSRPGTLFGGGPLTVPGALAIAAVLAVYTTSWIVRPGRVLVVDDFERAGCPRWWTFGFVPQERIAGEPGRGHLLSIRGAAPGTYAHGRGLYLDVDVGDRRTLELLVHGEGPGSGRLKIELAEDDNGNWTIEKQPPLYVPEHDDRFVHEVGVDWRGWRRLTLPLATFRDDNPGRGNDRFDPGRDLTSGGLLELQLLVSPAGPLGDDVRIAIDDIRFTP